jgi:SPP1 gp7 family putative phage head morphogenesis protein
VAGSSIQAAFKLPPARALAFFRGKGLSASFAWQDMVHEEHDFAFTVAKMLDLDLLAATRTAVDRAVAEGWTKQRFRDELQPVLERAGWWGKKSMVDPESGEEKLVQLGSPRRLDIIYDTNMRTAYSAGHWARIQDGKARRPFLMYSAIMDARTRPMHAAWNGTILPVDHAWWLTHFPPCGWNCRCTVISLSQRDLDRMGRGVSDVPPSTEYEWTNPRTGELVRVPTGIDPGWGYAPGAARREAIARMALEKIAGAPAELGAAAWPQLSPVLQDDVAEIFSRFVDAAIARGRARREWAIIGAAAAEDVAFLAARGRAPKTAEIAVEDRLLVGLKADRYERMGNALSVEEWKDVPAQLAGEPLVLFDTVNENLLYVFAAEEGERQVRIVVEPDFQPKKETRTLNAVRSARKLNLDAIEAQIRGGSYLVVRGRK